MLTPTSRFLQLLYQPSLRILYFLCGYNWFQNMGARRKKNVRILTLFLKEANFPVARRPDMLRDSLFTDLIDRLWGGQLINVAPLKVEGREHIEKAQAGNQGIILARFHQKLSSSKAHSLFENWLSQQKFAPALSVGGRRHTQTQTRKEFSNTQDLVEAYRTLRKGGIVQILPDGHQGTQAINLDFYEHQRAFRTGFAELAVSTHALILPVSLQFNMDGTLLIKISPALDLPDDIAPDQKIAHLIHQYVAGLDEYWQTNTHMILYSVMKKHMQAPKARIDGAVQNESTLKFKESV